MKTALILGGTGFIGSHIANNFVNQGYKVSVLCRNVSRNNQYHLDSSCKIISAPIESLTKLLSLKIDWDFDLVVNSCGIGDHTNFSNTSYDIIGSHLIGTINIIRLLKREKLKRYIHIGSSEEYGQLKNPSNEKLREEPITTYGFAKTAATHFLQMLYRSEQFPCLIIRPFLVYGENQNPTKLIPFVIDSCIKDIDFDLTEGNQYREFIHIKDLVELINSIANSSKSRINGNIYDVKSGDVFTVFEIVNLIKEIVGKGRPRFGRFEKRDSDIKLLYSASNNLYKDLGWQKKIPIEEGLKSIIEYRRLKND
tara:strand:+ start:196 stop:1125 length:930 start_codon:yes stop_codon:yes gene_type:complete